MPVGKATVVQDSVDQITGDGASEMCNFAANNTMYLGSQEERRPFLPNSKATGLGGTLSLMLVSREAASLPSYIGSKLGLRPSIIALLLLRVGLKPDVETGNFFCLAMWLHPKRNCGLDVVAQVATAFPKWQVCAVAAAKCLRHFSKDMEIAKNANAATDDHELSHEIGLLCKSTIIDSSNVHRLTVEHLAQRRRPVAALVKKHKETERERKKNTKEEAKAAAKLVAKAPKTATAAQQHQQQAQGDAPGRQLERGAGHPPTGGLGKGILALAAGTPGKRGKGEQARQNSEHDNLDIQSARVGGATPARLSSGNSGNNTPGASPGKRKQTRHLGLRATRAKPGASTSDLKPRAADAEVMGETELLSLFGRAQDEF